MKYAPTVDIPAMAYPLILTVDAAQVAGYRQWALNLVFGLCSRETVPNLATSPWQDFGELSTALSLCFSRGVGVGVVKLTSSFLARACVFFWAETRSEPWRQTVLCTVISSGSLRLYLQCFVCVHSFFLFHLFALIAVFLVRELSSMDVLTLKLHWVHILWAYSLRSRYIVVVPSNRGWHTCLLRDRYVAAWPYVTVVFWLYLHNQQLLWHVNKCNSI